MNDFARDALDRLQAGEAKQALAILQDGLATHPEDGYGWYLYGAAHQMLDSLDVALQAFLRSLELDPQNQSAQLNVATIWVEQSNLREALPLLHQLRETMPYEPILIRQLARAFSMKEEWETAYRTYCELVEVVPADIGAWHGLVMASGAAKRIADALLVLEQRGIYHLPKPYLDAMQAYLAFKMGLLSKQEALLAYSAWHPVDQDDLARRINVELSTHLFSNDFRAGLALLEQVKAQVEGWEAESSEGMLLLATGKWQEGWKHYARRGCAQSQVQYVNHIRPVPQWCGESLDGKVMLVHAEQGAGDIIQFIRYLPMLEKQGASLRLNINPAVAKLFLGSGSDEMYSASGDGVTEDCDFQTRLLDLPLYLHVDESNLPGEMPYLFCAEEKINYWKDRVSRYSGVKVGLVWAGNPNHWGDAHRSTSLDKFLPFFSIPGVTWFLLQKGQGEREYLTLPYRTQTISLAGEIKDFSDTAAALSQLDLLISVDTSVAHLAGALGLPVWVLLANRNQDWRWQMDRQDTPWYPTMRVCRQPEAQTWGQYIQSLIPELATHFQKNAKKANHAEATAWQWLTNVNSQFKCVVPQQWTTSWIRFAEKVALTSGQRELVDAIAKDRGSVLEIDWQEHLALMGVPEESVELTEKAPPSRWLTRLSSFTGDWDAYLSIATMALAQHPVSADLINAIARKAIEAEEEEYAISLLAKLTEISPKNRNAWFAKGTALLRLGKIQEAMEAFSSTWQFAEYQKDIAFELGSAFYRLGAYSSAEQCLRIYRRAACDDAPDVKWLKGIQVAAGAHDPAAGEYLEYLNEYLSGHGRHGASGALLLDHLSRCEELLQLDSLPSGLEIEGIEGLFALANLKLKIWEKGWPQYQAVTPLPFVPAPIWGGGSVPAGSHIVLFQDQGLGDTIQFLRMLPALRSRLGNVRLTIAVGGDLVSLMRFNLPGEIEVISLRAMRDGSVGRFDFSVPWMHLPVVLGCVPLDQPYGRTPYLSAPSLPDKLKDKKNIGIIWAGNPRHVQDFFRSTRLKDWAALLAVEGVRWHVLQKDYASDQATFDPHFDHVNTAALCNSLLDTAAEIQSMDLIISVDSGVAHLAGAMNIPTWILLSAFGTDFRWGADKASQAVWYPSVRLVWQQPGEAWTEVFGRLTEELRSWLAS